MTSDDKIPRVLDSLRISNNDSNIKFFSKSLFRRFITHDIGGSSVQIAYYILFSFFPFLIFLNALVGMLSIPSEWVTLTAKAVLPSDIVSMVSLYFSHLSMVKSPSLLFIGFFLALFSTSRAVKYLILALNKAYNTKDRRSGFYSTMISLFFTLLMFFSIFAAMVLIMLGNNIFYELGRFLSFPDLFLQLWGLIRWSALCLISLLTIALLYFIVPTQKQRFSSTFPGTIIAFVCWVLASWGFNLYVNNIAQYSLIYGSIGTIIIFMIWIYITGNILIMGGEINHILITMKNRSPRKKSG